jgi:hypothetical protein
MTPLGTDESSWAAGVSARLRVLQASFADDPAETRQDYLKEELERALRDVPASRRRGYLAALNERFPAGEPTAPPAAAAPSSAAPSAPVELSAGEHAERLAGMAASLSAEDRRALAQYLAQAGIAVEAPAPAPVSHGAAAPVTVPPELQKKLGLNPDQPLDTERVLELIAALVDMVVTLDHLSWSLWKKLAPQSIVRRESGEDLRRLTGPYLVGDRNVNIRNLTPAMNKTRQLIGSLLAAIGATGESFARSYLARFSPESIKEAADAEPGFFIGPEQKCWRKYVEMFQETSGVVIENEITGALVKYAEDLMLGTSRAGQSHAGGGREG